MCGIAGYVGEGREGDLRAMGDRLAHRGPDGEGVFRAPDAGVHLLHRRLAIIDLATGDQPMWNEDRTVCVIFNGEIYNHVALRAELVAKGHRFASHHSDTEVLVHGYEEWGTELPGRLNGMFAFAIWDAPRRRLFLARDRFGKKPLYYACRPGLFAFASELTALAAHSGVRTEVDRDSLRKLFAYGFIPAPRSFYRDVSKLPGGHWMAFEIDRPGVVTVRRYWQFEIETDHALASRPEESLAEELRHLLERAVERRLMSDVPLGIFLSGGIDSSAVLAYAAKHMPAGNVHTFSIGFHEPSFDESAHARAVASHFGTQHHEEMLGIDRARDMTPEVLGRLDEPFGDPSIVPTYLLCEFARRRITVALGGDGGDELFAGYDPFKALAAARWFRRLTPGWLRGGIRSLAEMLPVSDGNMGLDFKIKRGLRGASQPPSLWNPVWLGPLEPRELAELFLEPVAPEAVYEEAIAAWDGSKAGNDVDRTLEFYTRFYLQDDILVKGDRASMMVSLEVRSPFLDNDLVDFARRLPHALKYRNGRTKHLLKFALRGVVPDEVLERRKKGFGIPLTRWLRTWDPAAFERGGIVAGNAGWAAAQLREHQAGSRDNRLALWCLLALGHHRGAAGIPAAGSIG